MEMLKGDAGVVGGEVTHPTGVSPIAPTDIKTVNLSKKLIRKMRIIEYFGELQFRLRRGGGSSMDF